MGKSRSSKRGYDEIDESLRRAYDEVVSEGVPDRFSNLLKQLKDGDLPLPTDAEGKE